jgi:hypothetical protein
MTPQEHAEAITAAAEQLRAAVDRARLDLPVGRARVVVAAMGDALDDFGRLEEELEEVLES